MAKANKNEALIAKTMKDLPTLGGLKETSLNAVKEFPFVKITDNTTATVARKNRTGLVKIRTGLQNERTSANKILSNVKEYLKNEIDDIISVTKPHEERQQIEVDLWDEEKARVKAEKEEKEDLRVNTIKNRISGVEIEIGDLIDKMDLSNIDKILEGLKTHIVLGRKFKDDDFDFMEFEILYDDMEIRMLVSYDEQKKVVQDAEKKRLEDLDKDQKAKIDEIYRECTELIFSCNDSDKINDFVKNSFKCVYDFGENQEKLNDTKKTVFSQANIKIDQLLKEKAQNKKENRLNGLEFIANHRELIVQSVEGLTLENSIKNIKTIQILIDCPSFDTSLIVKEYDNMKLLMTKKLTNKRSVLSKEQKILDKKSEKIQEKKDKQTKERRAELRVLGFVPNKDNDKTFIGFGKNITEERIEDSAPDFWVNYLVELQEDIIEFKKNDKAEKLRQKKLKIKKVNLGIKVQEVLGSYKVNEKETDKEVLEFDEKILEQLSLWSEEMEQLIKQF